MKGFADYTYILLSDPAKYVEASGFWRRQYELALNNLLTYLKDKETWIRCLATDHLAQSLLDGNPQIEWQSTESRGGMYFLQQNDGIPDRQYLKLPKDIEEALDKKYPIERGMTVERRKFLETKRVALAEKMLIKQAKCLFVFTNYFRPAPKENDGRAVITINNQFIPSMKLSGNDAPVGSFLDTPWANLSLIEWGKNLNG